MKWAVTILAFCVASLLALGMVMLYSSSMAQVGAGYLMRQLIWCGVGLAAWNSFVNSPGCCAGACPVEAGGNADGADPVVPGFCPV